MPRKKSAAKKQRELEALEQAKSKIERNQPTRKGIFDDDDNDENYKSDMKFGEFKINEEYARRFEHNKAREEMFQLEEKLKNAKESGLMDSDEDDSESETEDEDGDLVTPSVDAAILSTIMAVRAKDDEIYKADVNFFERKEKEAEVLARSSRLNLTKAQHSHEKPMHLKDYHRQTLLRKVENGEFVNDDDDDEKEEKKIMTFSEEQEQLRNEFKKDFESAGPEDGANNQEEDDGFFKFKSKTDNEKQKEDLEYQQFLKDSVNNKQAQKILDSIVHKDTGKKAIGSSKSEDFSANTLSKEEQDKFLIDFIMNRKWLSKSSGKRNQPLSELVEDAMEDENFEDNAEEYEETTKSRLDELLAKPTGPISHGRGVEGSLRRKDDKRKREREARKERKRAEKEKFLAELNRLKHLKEKSIADKINMIKAIAGDDVDVNLNDLDLDEDFDPAKWDSKMNKIFTDDFYAKASSKDLKAPPEFPEENVNIHSDELFSNNNENGDHEVENDKDGQQNIVENKDSSKQPSLKRKRNAEMKKNIEEFVTDKLKFGYEDVLPDGFVTRFKYVQTDADSYGLDPVEILQADDAELNEYIGLKKLNPYRPKDLQARDKRVYCKKKRLKEWRKKLRQNA